MWHGAKTRLRLQYNAHKICMVYGKRPCETLARFNCRTFLHVHRHLRSHTHTPHRARMNGIEVSSIGATAHNQCSLDIGGMCACVCVEGISPQPACLVSSDCRYFCDFSFFCSRLAWPCHFKPLRMVFLFVGICVVCICSGKTICKTFAPTK